MFFQLHSLHSKKLQFHRAVTEVSLHTPDVAIWERTIHTLLTFGSECFMT